MKLVWLEARIWCIHMIQTRVNKFHLAESKLTFKLTRIEKLEVSKR